MYVYIVLSTFKFRYVITVAHLQYLRGPSLHFVITPVARTSPPFHVRCNGDSEKNCLFMQTKLYSDLCLYKNPIFGCNFLVSIDLPNQWHIK